MARFKHIFSLASFLILLSGCSSSKSNEFKVAATAIPHAQILESIQPMMEEQGIEMVIVVIDDYNMPNRALADREIQANFFQHSPFLEEQIRQFNYPLSILTKVELEPIGVYSRRIKSFSELKAGAIIAIPSDPTNEARALRLLQSNGFIELDKPDNLQATVLNIVSNPKKLRFIEVDAAMIARSLEDVDMAVINTNYALESGLSPQKEALAIEDSNSPYVNVIAICKEDEKKPEIQALKKAITSDKTREFILKTYKGAVLPVF